MKSPTSSQGTVLFSGSLNWSLAWGVSRQNIRRKMKRWLEDQHLVLWRGPCSTQRQAQELIFGPDLATRARLLSFSRTQSRVVIGLLTGHNTLRRHLYRVSQEECARLREGVPYVKVYRYNPKHLCPKLNSYGDNGQRKVWASGGSTHCTCQLTSLIDVCP